MSENAPSRLRLTGAAATVSKPRFRIAKAGHYQVFSVLAFPAVVLQFGAGK
jgi:hypothetical protein